MPQQNLDYLKSPEGRAALIKAGVDPDTLGDPSLKPVDVALNPAPDPNPQPFYLGDSPKPKEVQIEQFKQAQKKLSERKVKADQYDRRFEPELPKGKVDPKDLLPTPNQAFNQAQAGAVQPASFGGQTGAFGQGHAQDAVNRYDKGIKTAKAGLFQSYMAGAEKAAFDQGALEQSNKQLLEQNDRVEGIKVDLKQKFKENEQAFNQAFEQLNQQDPLTKTGAMKQWFSKRSTPTKILAGIGYAAAIAASATKSNLGPTALRIFDDVFQSEIEAQKAEMSNKRFMLSNRTNMMKMAMNMFGNEMQAESFTHGLMAKYTANQFKINAARAASPELKAQFLKLAGDYEQQAAKDIFQINQVSFNNALATSAASKKDDIKPLSGESAGKFSIALSSLEDIASTSNRFKGKAGVGADGVELGTIDWNLIGESEKEQIVNALTETLARGLSGAAIPEDEWNRFMMWVPRKGDSKAEALKKMNRLESIFTGTVTSMDPQGKLRRQIYKGKQGSIQEVIQGNVGEDLGFRIR